MAVNNMGLETVQNLSFWVENYTSELYVWALHKVSNADKAKDLVQDTFLAAAEKIHDFKGDSSPKTWLFSILRYKIIDHYREKVKSVVSQEDNSLSFFFDANGEWLEERKPQAWDNDEEHNLLDDTEFLHVLQACLDALPDTWSTSIKLKYLMEKNGEEICRELGVSPSNFWQIVHRAKLQLRNCIERNWYLS